MARLNDDVYTMRQSLGNAIRAVKEAEARIGKLDLLHRDPQTGQLTITDDDLISPNDDIDAAQLQAGIEAAKVWITAFSEDPVIAAAIFEIAE